jgi:hypothetical protein
VDVVGVHRRLLAVHFDRDDDLLAFEPGHILQHAVVVGGARESNRNVTKAPNSQRIAATLRKLLYYSYY